ncbi:MAG: hypothetical protein Q8N16_00090 [bacterium]|nr:hypothetical protein [bacterium]
MKLKKRLLISLFLFLLAVFSYFFVGRAPKAEKIAWGVDFSQKHAENLGLIWQEAYLALLEDLNVKNLKISTSWDLLEREKRFYDFSDLDWQIDQAGIREAKILLVIGMKTPRWPECHLPDWAKTLPKQEREKAVLDLLEKIVLRYRENPVVWAWQVENEPLFDFGDCPPPDKIFLKKEVDLVKKLDSRQRPIVVSDSGEWSFWFQAAKIGDIVGITLYRTVWFKELGVYSHYPFPPVFYHRKAELVEKIFNKRVINIELQAEPWGPKLLYGLPLAEQQKTMTLKKFRDNIEFAQATGLDTFYLWGSEWWYWLKEKHQDPSFWQEAKKIFQQID